MKQEKQKNQDNVSWYLFHSTQLNFSVHLCFSKSITFYPRNFSVKGSRTSRRKKRAVTDSFFGHLDLHPIIASLLESTPDMTAPDEIALDPTHVEGLLKEQGLTPQSNRDVLAP